MNIITKFKKNSKLLKVTKLHYELLKTKHILRFFLGGFKRTQFQSFFKLIKSPQLFLEFLKYIETRLEFILLKSGVVLTGFQAKYLILNNNLFLNKIKITTSNFKLKVGDFITFENSYIKSYKTLLIINLFKTIYFFKFLKKKNLTNKVKLPFFFSYLRFPFFLEINFKTFTICFVRAPVFSEFFFSNYLSLYDFNQLYFIL